ncbi:MAG: hypothetical protein IPL18_05720 [Sphingomonadales bacterium]|nr:hypothetical protein [Sphingomonadales bacterium]
MEAIATPHRFDGEAFVASVAERGSAPVVAPLGVFLDRCSTMPDLRKQVRDSLPALLADVAHFMAITHGRHPGIIEQAATRIVEQDARGWIIAASDAFAAERMFLNRLTVVAGPIRRHFDQDKVNATLAGQHRSFEMLATSNRRGCAAGAVTAFVVDWLETRPVLERVALMLGVEVPSCTLPSKGHCAALASLLAATTSQERALNFGAEQVLAQQKGIWQLIAARHAVTSHS